MTPMTRSRVTVLVAIAAFAMVVAFAVADNITRNAPSKDASESTSSGYIDGSAGAPLAAPDSGEREPYTGGLQERLPGSSKPDKKECKGEKRCDEKKGNGEDEQTVQTVAAAFGPTDSGDDDSGLTPPCTDTDSCVGEINQLIPRVRERVSDLPLIRECESSIGGEALCFDFGDGKYLVGDAPDDGAAELGFCTPSGYYYVSGPTLEGGAGVACPGEHGNNNGGNGDDVPTTRECTSLSGGDATCFDFGDGKYIVSDPLADGGGELGFCTSSGYYYVSAPSAAGEAGAKCPDAPPAP
jgi:hypothetical protein